MARCPDLYPPLAPTVEYEPIGYDFGALLSPGETITSILSVTIAVVSGTDPTPNARLIGPAVLAPSVKTGALSAEVIQGVGNMVNGVVYDTVVTVLTSNALRRQLQIEGRIPCSQ